MIDYKDVTYYELTDCKYINPDLKVAKMSKFLYEAGIAKQKSYTRFSEYPIWLPFEFSYPLNWENKLQKTHELYGEYCLILLEAKEFGEVTNSKRKYYKADGKPGHYYCTHIYLTQEGMSKLREYVETSPHLFPLNYTSFQTH